MRTVERPAPPSGPCLVAGLGKAGRGAVEALLSTGEKPLFAWDRSQSPHLRGLARRLRGRGVKVWLGGDGLDALSALMAALEGAPGSPARAGEGVCLVKSPGIGFDTPLLLRAAECGIAVIDELELGWRTRSNPIVAVTGTNGKSTTAKLIAALLEGAGLGGELVGNTEFGPPLSSAAAAAAAAAGAGGWLVAEVSSFQLEGCPRFMPEVAVLTNLTPEHLDRHGTMARYGQLKRKMFIFDGHAAPVSVVNHDDPFGRRLADELTAAGASVLRYGMQAGADFHVERAAWDLRRARLLVETPAGGVELTTRLPGAHNARNLAAALAVAHALGLALDDGVLKALSHTDPPSGRWELASGAEDSFDAIVDYAHTPDGIVQALSALRAVVRTREGARLRTVFGAVGLKDADKARDSARAVASLSDHVVFTTGTAPGDPRLLRLAELRKAAADGDTDAVEGAGGVAGKPEIEIVLERRRAIERALAEARPGDVVAVLGLGALGRQIVDATGTIVPFDDREAVREALAELRGS